MTRRSKFVVAAVTLSLAATWVMWPPPPSAGNAEHIAYPPDYLDVAEAVFRHQFDHNASGTQRRVKYFFLSLEANDPPNAFLARFANEWWPYVRPASMEAQLRGPRLIFSISSVKWLDADTAEVEGGYYHDTLSSSGNLYRVERRAGKWSVTKDELKWIS
ncbi:MAG: hypothetical protein K8U03_05510 [Planctomycetia bacterium]|nr:hypothetical protein [Planctomycetia bacterium]